MCFANDLVIITKPVTSSLVVLSNVLNYFNITTGLQMNLSKYSIMVARLSARDKESITASTNLPIMEQGVTYLGVPLSISRIRKHHRLSPYKKIIARLN